MQIQFGLIKKKFIQLKFYYQNALYKEKNHLSQ